MGDDDGYRRGAEAARRLTALGAADLAPGLSDHEFDRVEATFGFRFADDHRAFLSIGLPMGGQWPDWRDGSRKDLQRRLQWPTEGIIFDVEWNEFWCPAWGDRPPVLKHALRSARWQLERVPQLVPVFGHRYLPAGHGTSGHPVLSVYQTDIVCYGADLADYIDTEFGHADPQTATPTVGFWSDLVS